MKVFEKWESEIRGYCRAYPTVFVSAKNARQVDENGKTYIDFFAGAGVLNFGHNDENMKKAIIKYMESDGVTHSLDMYTSAKRKYLSAFASTILEPRKMEYKMQFTGPTGSNAVEAALKLARKVTGRTNVVAFSHGFHGMTLGSLACTANAKFRNAAGIPLEHVSHIDFDGNNGIEKLKQYKEELEDSSSGIAPPAAFIVEVIQAEGGVRIASKKWLRYLQDMAHEYESLFIIDEIQVGCGRTGSFFSFDNMDIQPDIICLAKGIGGFGTPMAMNLNKPDFDSNWSPGEHTGTFRGQDLSFVAGREALRYFENDSLMNEVNKKGKMINEHLKKIVRENSGHNTEVRGVGMIQALDIFDGAKAKAIQKECFQNGLLIGPCGRDGQVLKLIPPLTIPEEDLMEGLNTLSRATSKILKGV